MTARPDGFTLWPEAQIPGLAEGRQVVGMWLVEQLAEKLDARWEDVMNAFCHLPLNSIAMLDSPEGLNVVAYAVSQLMGRDGATHIMPATH